MSAEQLTQIQKAELDAIMGSYVAVGILLLVMGVIIYFTKVPKVSTKQRKLIFGLR